MIQIELSTLLFFYEYIVCLNNMYYRKVLNGLDGSYLIFLSMCPVFYVRLVKDDICTKKDTICKTKNKKLSDTFDHGSLCL